MEINRYHFDSLDSTNNWAKEHAEEFLTDCMTVISASQQTAGRGRFKRQWVSPNVGNIYTTFCFFIPDWRNDLGNVPQILALSTAKVLERLGFTPVLKWPNDLLLNKKKVGGILCETTTVHKAVAIIVGLGLNVNMPQEILSSIDRPATSLKVISGKDWDVSTLSQAIEKQFTEDLEKFLDDGFELFHGEYLKRLQSDPTQVIQFDDNEKIWRGTFHKFNENGSLTLKLESGELRTFISGEILF